jgi:hypothetical protein
LLLLWFLKVPQVQASSLPGAGGFTPTYTCRKRESYSRKATAALSTRLKQNLNNQNRPETTDISEYIPEFYCTIDNKQI